MTDENKISKIVHDIANELQVISMLDYGAVTPEIACEAYIKAGTLMIDLYEELPNCKTKLKPRENKNEDE